VTTWLNAAEPQSQVAQAARGRPMRTVDADGLVEDDTGER
jgi:hypothetical protein